MKTTTRVSIAVSMPMNIVLEVEHDPDDPDCEPRIVSSRASTVQDDSVRAIQAALTEDDWAEIERLCGGKG